MLASGQLHSFELLLIVLLFFVVLFAALARRIGTPYPIVLVVAGLFLSYLPGIPRIELNPEVVFLVVLPPLLYAGAWMTNWRDFKSNLVSILFLAIGLVGFTVVGVARTARWVFPGFDWQLGLVLGAVVSTTDAIAATAIAKRLSLPQRIVDIIEGESLVNDATGLLALEVALNIVVRGQIPSATSSTFRLLYLIVVGIAIGLLVARFVKWFEQYIDDGPIEIVISILIPYTVY